MDGVANKRATLTLNKPRHLKLVEKSLSSWWPNTKEPPSRWVVPHPIDGIDFGLVPAMSSHGHQFNAGPVYLLYGEHWDRHRGYGYVHILEGHWRELKLATKDASPNSLVSVANFVAGILSSPAPILCEFADMRGNHRPVVVKGKKGSVILEPRTDNGTGLSYYSVVSAMTGTNKKGPQIGTF